MVAESETEDLIIEYSMRREIITNPYIKEGDQESPNCKMLKHHLRDWPDDTRRIKEEGLSEALSQFSEAISFTLVALLCYAKKIQTVCGVDADDIGRF